MTDADTARMIQAIRSDLGAIRIALVDLTDAMGITNARMAAIERVMAEPLPPSPLINVVAELSKAIREQTAVITSAFPAGVDAMVVNAKWRAWLDDLQADYLGVTDNEADPLRLAMWDDIRRDRPAPDEEGVDAG